MSNMICLQCHQTDKRKDYQFCSKKCTDAAAARAPGLLRVPKDHVMYNDVKKQFKKGWESNAPLPTISRIYLITWPKEMRSSFDNYRASVAKQRHLSSGKVEVKRFRAEARACELGDPGKGNQKLCKRPDGDCRLCTAIRTGFKYSLHFKRNFALTGTGWGVRFGGGLYMAPSSSKAYDYAINQGNGSDLRCVLMSRVVLGNPEHMYQEDHRKVEPSPGYDSVETRMPGEPRELVVYNDDAARPAYMLMLK